MKSLTLLIVALAALSCAVAIGLRVAAQPPGCANGFFESILVGCPSGWTLRGRRE